MGIAFIASPGRLLTQTMVRAPVAILFASLVISQDIADLPLPTATMRMQISNSSSKWSAR
jgi:hypothetical protein